jgi:hypothetical protein
LVGDGFSEPGFSKERRLEPQITIGLLTDGRPGLRGPSASARPTAPTSAVARALVQADGDIIVTGNVQAGACLGLDGGFLPSIIAVRFRRRPPAHTAGSA